MYQEAKDLYCKIKNKNLDDIRISLKILEINKNTADLEFANSLIVKI